MTKRGFSRILDFSKQSIMTLGIALLCAQLFLSPAIAQEAQSTNRDPLKERALLQALSHRISFVLSYNLEKTERLIECLEHDISSEYCDKEIGYIQNNISLQYPRVRQFSILYNLMRQGVFAGLIEAFYKQTENKFLLTRMATPERIEVDVFRKSFGGDDRFLSPPISNNLPVDTLPNPPLQPHELDRALNAPPAPAKSYKRHFQEVCQSYGPDFLSLCESLRLSFNPDTLALYIEPVDWTEEQFEAHREKLEILRLTPMGMRSHRGVPDGLSEMTQATRIFNEKRKTLKERVFDTAKINPFVLFSTCSNPGDLELIHIFEQIRELALKSIEDYQKLIDKIDEGTASRRKELSLLMYDPIVADVVNNPTRSMIRTSAPGFDWNQVLGPLNQEYFAREMKFMGWIISGVILGNVACYVVPVGRAAGIAAQFFRSMSQMRNIVRMKNAFKPLCFTTTNVAINLGFLTYSLHEYQKTYRDIFLAVDDDHYLRELNNLNMAELMVVVDAISLPLGTGLGNYLFKRGVRLSERTTSILERQILQAQ